MSFTSLYCTCTWDGEGLKIRGLLCSEIWGLISKWGLIFWDIKIRILWYLTMSFLAWNNSCSTQSAMPCHAIFFVVFYSTMFTASTDKTLGIWDYETGTRIKKLKGHSSFVNSCFPSRRGPQYIVSGADDCTVKVSNIWQTKLASVKIKLQKLQFSMNSKEFPTWYTLNYWSKRKRTLIGLFSQESRCFSIPLFFIVIRQVTFRF